jgi:hypothetical protein
MCEHTFVRWDNLSIEEEEKARLAGYRDEAVVRHFEAPDAVPTRFYEVRAKSILNRVPEASAMPFRWTINPYRGCTHSCVYCASGDTPILMADGRHKALDEVDVGDQIYGTQVGESGYRRYVRTTVLNKWTTIKPAFRLTLEGGTELIVSGDHRFLSDRGWKHVRDSERGQPGRPHLTTRNHLAGTGAFPAQPSHTAEYRRGYLCGIVRGDGTLGAYALRRARGGAYTGYRFRLALADLEALRRTRDFLRAEEVQTGQRVFQRRPVRRVKSSPSRPRAPPRLSGSATSLNGRWFPASTGAVGSWPGSSTQRGAAAPSRSGSRTPIRRSWGGSRRVPAGSGSTHAWRTGIATTA